jgi:hypothetical protein
MTLEVTLAVQQELEARAAETDTLRRQHLERTRYEAEQARARYMKVDPDNRLVADTLEAEWNGKLRHHAEAVEAYERHREEQAATIDAETRRRVLALAEDFPRIWRDPRVDNRERKRILRLLVTDVTLIKAETITVHVRLSGGATRTLELERPRPIAQIRKIKPDLRDEVDRLLDQHCDREVAEILNANGWRTWESKPFDHKKIAFIRATYNLTSRCDRLRRKGLLMTKEVAARFGVSGSTVNLWGRQGLIEKHRTDSRNRGLWSVPDDYEVVRGCGGNAQAVTLVRRHAQSPERGAV